MKTTREMRIRARARLEKKAASFVGALPENDETSLLWSDGLALLDDLDEALARAEQAESAHGKSYLRVCAEVDALRADLARKDAALNTVALHGSAGGDKCGWIARVALAALDPAAPPPPEQAKSENVGAVQMKVCPHGKVPGLSAECEACRADWEKRSENWRKVALAPSAIVGDVMPKPEQDPASPAAPPAQSKTHHVKGCGTERRGCMPGCSEYDPRYDYMPGDGGIAPASPAAEDEHERAAREWWSSQWADDGPEQEDDETIASLASLLRATHNAAVEAKNERANRYHQSLGAKWMCEAIAAWLRDSTNGDDHDRADAIERRWEDRAFWDKARAPRDGAQ